MERKKIYSIERKRQDYLITFYDESTLMILYRDYSRLDIIPDNELNSDLIKELDDNYQFEKCKNYGLKLLGTSQLSIYDMKTRMKKKKYPDDLIDRAIDYFEKNDLLNDSRFAESFIRVHMQYDKDGYLKIKTNLRKHGVSDKIIQDQLTQVYSDEYENDVLKELIQKKLKTYPENLPEKKKKEKVFLYLTNKGFGRFRILHALSSFFRDEP